MAHIRITEYPYTGTITRTVEGKGLEKDSEVKVYEGMMDEHMRNSEEGTIAQTSSYILSMPLTKTASGEWVVPRNGDMVALVRYGETLHFVVDNAEPSQLGGISVYATRQSW